MVCEKGNLEAMLILTKSDKINLSDPLKKTFHYDHLSPLQIACREYGEHNNLEFIKFLLENNADVNVRNNLHWTSLHKALYLFFETV